MPFDPYAYDLAASRQTSESDETLADEALLAVPLEARSTLWRGLMRAVEDTLALW